MCAEIGLALEHADGHPRVAEKQLACDSEPDDAAADDGEVAALGSRPWLLGKVHRSQG